jgi:hypothetical protein
MGRVSLAAIGNFRPLVFDQIQTGADRKTRDLISGVFTVGAEKAPY